MNKLKLFLENFLVYGLGGILSKAVPLIMVPIVTKIMPGTEYFGISDLLNTIASFGGAIALMGMYDAMYRMFFEKDEAVYKKTVCSTALTFTLCTSAVVFVLMLALKNSLAQFVLRDRKYANIIYLSAMAAFVSATNGIISAPTRMQNKKKVFLVTNALSPLLSYSISIPLLLAGHYVIALPLAAVVSGVTLEAAFGVMNRKWFRLRLFDKCVLKQMLVIALPLVPNFLIYWIFNSCDRLMISSAIGVAAEGIYSVGSKLGHASQLIYTAFAGGWQFFAFATMKEDNQVKSNSMIFEYLGILSFMATSFICAWSFGLFKLLFKADYLSGYVVAPYLFLAPLLQMLYQVIANQFLIIKKTWPSSLMLASGAVINLIFNYFMIPIWGIEGAALATLIGYAVTDIVCSVTLIRMKLLVVDKRFAVSALVMLVFLIIWRLFISTSIVMGTVLALAASVFWAFMYREDVRKLLGRIRNRASTD